MKTGTMENAPGRTAFLMKNVVGGQVRLKDLDFIARGSLVLNYYVAKSGVFTAVVRDGKMLSCTYEKIPRDRLAALIRSFNSAAEAGDRERFETKGRKLYQLLLHPVESFLTGSSVLISPRGVLHNLPFGALQSDGCFIEKQSIGYVYSLSFLHLLKNRHGNANLEPARLHPLLMGNPVNRKVDAVQLPGAEKEAAAVSNILNEVCTESSPTPYLGTDAGERRFKKRIHAANLVHLATHSRFDPADAENSFIMLADGAGEDGLLYAREIYGLDMTADQGIELLVLSSCESGALDVRPGDDPYGLPRAWFYAGAKRILSTYWAIDDRQTVLLMTSFYRHMLEKGLSPIKALQQARIEQIKSGSLAWVPFKIEGMACLSE